jgi:adenylyltransferase/sulfurtransferase
MEIDSKNAIKYAAQINLEGFDFARQEKLLRAHVLIVGVGGLGCYAAQTLCAAGVGEITIVDHDKVQLSNLSRQILFCEADIGLAKATQAKARLLSQNYPATVNCVVDKFDENMSAVNRANIDLILDCTDNMAVRLKINRFAAKSRIPLISGAAIRMQGQLFAYQPKQADSACFECISSFFYEQNAACSESGILSPVVGIIGNHQALQALKLLADYGDVEANRLSIFDAMTSKWSEFKVTRAANCQTCKNSAL